MQDFYKHKHVHSSSDNTISSRFTKKSITACQKTKEKEKKKRRRSLSYLNCKRWGRKRKKRKKEKKKSTQTSKVVTKEVQSYRLQKKQTIEG